MQRRLLTAIFAGVAVFILACAEDEPSPPLGGWEFKEPPFPGAWVGCTVQSDGTFWAAVLRAPSSQPAVARYRDGSWTITDLPTSETTNIHDVIVFDDGSGWATGNCSKLFRLRADAWEPMTLFNNVEFYHLTGTDGSHVWVNGITRPYGIPESLVLFFDGREWKEEVKLTGYSSYGPMLALSDDAALMVARRDTGDEIIRMTHAGWRRERRFDHRHTIYRLAASGGDVYAVGEKRGIAVTEGKVLQLEPEARDLTPPRDLVDPTLYCYVSALALGPDNLWVAAAPYDYEGDCAVLHWDGLRWKRAPVSNRTGGYARFSRFAFDEAGHGWAVGGNGYARFVAP